MRLLQRLAQEDNIVELNNMYFTRLATSKMAI